MLASRFTLGHAIFLFLISFNVIGLKAQAVNNQIKDVVMPSANAASLGKYGDIPVSYYTGVPNVGIPITSIQDGPLSLPISLSYHAGGVKVGELSSWVGLGWSLQAGGMISRTVQGIADERDNGYFKIGYDISIINGCIVRNSNGGSDIANATFNGQLAAGQMDGEPDIFSFSVGGYNGKFFIDKGTSTYGSGKVVLIQTQDIKIDYTVVQDYTETALKKFTITTPDGVKYEFGDVGDGSPAIEVTRPVATANGYANGWYLKRITTPDNKSKIFLNYTKEIYRYGSRTSNGETTNGTYFTPTSGYLENRNDIFGYRLDNITTSTGVEKVTFVTNGDRTDVLPTPGATAPDNAKKLGSIKVENGAYCKTFTLTQTYFKDNSAQKVYLDEADTRLRLDRLQEAPCVADVSTQTVEPYIFTYYGQLGNIDYLPNRFSAAIDHWGYANGANGNPKTGLNIPYTRLKYNKNGTPVDEIKGISNRETDEDNMLLGTIKQINYPTGGNTAFEFEANTYQDLTGDKALQDVGSVARYWPTGNCYLDPELNIDPNTTQAFNGGSSYTMPAIANVVDLDNLFYKWEKVCTTNPNCSNDCPGTMTLRVYNANTQAYINGVTLSAANVTDKLSYLISNLTTGISYKFVLVGQNWGGQFTIQKEVTVLSQPQPKSWRFAYQKNNQ